MKKIKLTLGKYAIVDNQVVKENMPLKKIYLQPKGLFAFYPYQIINASELAK